MEIEKCLFGLICAASLIGGFATSLEIAHGAGQKELSQPPATTATITREQPSFFNPAGHKPASSEANPTVARYYFEHYSEFAPLPQSPNERAQALHQIESVIRQKLATEKHS